MDNRERLKEKLEVLKEYGVYMKHDPSVTGMGGEYYSGRHTVTIGRTTINDLIDICDRLIKEEKEKRDYDPAPIDDIIKEVYG